MKKPIAIVGLTIAAAVGAAVYVGSGIKTVPSGEGSAAADGSTRDAGEMLAVGTEAPDFEAIDHNGETVRLSSYRGSKNVVLIFYPGNETPGCTTQLCSARDEWDVYTDNDTIVFGVNPASVESHRKFAENHNFPFPLISDESGEVTRAFGARGPLGVVRRTVYTIDKSGKIVFAERGMPATESILEAVRIG